MKVMSKDACSESVLPVCIGMVLKVQAHAQKESPELSRADLHLLLQPKFIAYCGVGRKLTRIGSNDEPVFNTHLNIYMYRPECKNLYWPAGNKLCHPVVLLFCFCVLFCLWFLVFEFKSHVAQLTLNLLGSQG